MKIVESYKVRSEKLLINTSLSGERNYLKDNVRVYSSLTGELKFDLEKECFSDRESILISVTLPEEGVGTVIVSFKGYDEITRENKIILFSNSFIENEDRHKDLETSAYIARQTALNEDNSVVTRCTMAVVYGYNSVDLMDDRASAESCAILQKIYSLTDSLKNTNHIRTNKDNIQLSMLLTICHLAVFLSDYNLFGRYAKQIYSKWISNEANLMKINGSMAFNLVKFINIAAVALWKHESCHEVKVLLNKSIEVFKFAINDFSKNNANINEFSVLSSVHKDVVRSLFIRNIIEERKLPVGKHPYELLELDKNSIQLKDFYKHLFRARSGLNELILRINNISVDEYPSELYEFRTLLNQSG